MRFLFVLAGLTALAIVAVPPAWSAVHWLLFGLAIWAVCSLMRPRHASPLPPRWEMARVREPIRRPERPRQASTDLPLDVSLKADQIRRKAESLERQRDRFPFASHDLYVARATRLEYLPRTIRAFLAVPAASRQRALPNGKTPLQELKDQLRLLDAKLDEIAEDLERRNIDGLLANRRFLEQRFGRVIEL